MPMRLQWLLQALVPVLATPGFASAMANYELTGRIEPPAPVSVYLHGALKPYQNSTTSGDDGRFRFSKVPEGTYTLVISTEARGEVLQTVELSAGTVDSRGRLDLVLTIDPGKLESESGKRTAATVSAIVLSIPDRAVREYTEAQNCLTRVDGRETACATAHLRRAVEIAPRFTAAWNQLGTMAYQDHEYNQAEADFRKALEADPDAFEPLVNLGGVLLNLARPREALAYNQRAVGKRPNNALANSQLGLAYFYLNEVDAAEKSLKIAVSLDPAHFSHPQLTLAQIYERRGDRTSALGQLRDFLGRHPDAPQVQAVRAKIAELSR